MGSLAMTEEPPSQDTAPAAGEPPYPAPVVVPVAVTRYRTKLRELIAEATYAVPQRSLTKAEMAELEDFLLDIDICFDRPKRMLRAKQMAEMLVPENQDKRNREIMRVTMNLMEADVGTLVQLWRAAEDAKLAHEAPVTSVTEAKLQQATIHRAGTPAQKRWCQRFADAIKNGLDNYPMTQRTPWF